MAPDIYSRAFQALPLPDRMRGMAQQMQVEADAFFRKWDMPTREIPAVALFLEGATEIELGERTQLTYRGIE